MAATNLYKVPAIIASGTSLSAGATVHQYICVGFIVPSAWTAADLTFQVSSDNGVTYRELYNSLGTPIQYTPVAGVQFAVDGKAWAGVDLVKVRSGTLTAPVNQGADRTITLLLKILG